MPLYFHGDAPLKFQHQYLVTRDYIMPFIDVAFPIKSGMQVLEIGCGEGGVLKAFAERGCICTGMDLSETKIEHGKELLKEEVTAGLMHLFCANIYDQATMDKFRGQFDLIVLKDTIEHIPDQEKVMAHLPVFLKEGGKMFFAFPPWRMPFGGHQQTAVTKKGKRPWMHLLSRAGYEKYLRNAGESQGTIDSLMEIYDTRISIGRFEKILNSNNYKVVRKRFYLINPIYRFKFKLTPREQFPVLKSIPWLRDFYTTTSYYLLGR